MTAKHIYFDNAAAAPLAPAASEVLNGKEPWMWANASASYSLGKQAKHMLDKARRTIAGCIDAEPCEIVFTSGGTEGTNMLLKGLVGENRRMEVITSPFEHAATTKTMAETPNIKTRYLPVKSDGQIDIPLYKKTTEWVADHPLAVIMLVNNELGTVNPLYPFAVNGSVLCDAVQAVGHIPVSVDKLGVDYLIASGHKFGGPKGTGFVYIRHTARKLVALLDGGGQENGMRAGTENVPGYYAMSLALQAACENMEWNMKHTQMLKEHCLDRLREIEGVVMNGDPLAKGSYGVGIVNFSLPDMYVNGHTLQWMLDMPWDKYTLPVCVSTGSACASSSSKPSAVLMALPDMAYDRANKSLRVSFGPQNEKWEVDYFVQKLKAILGTIGKPGQHRVA